MDIETQNEYNVYSQTEIINRCKFGNNHIMHSRLLSGSLISQRQEQDEINENNR